MKSSKSCVAVLSVGLVVGVATTLFAAKVKFLERILVPGAAVDGNLVLAGDSGAADAKGAVNTGNGQVRASLKGVALNFSGKAQNYKSNPVVEASIELQLPVDVQLSKYKIGKPDGQTGTGKCRGSFKGRVVG